MPKWYFLVAPCNVTRGCGMTCHWIRPNVQSVSQWNAWPATGRSALQDLRSCAILQASLAFSPVSSSICCTPYWNSTSGFDFDQHQLTCHSAPVCEILSKPNRPRQKKMTSCRFSRWQISAILDFTDAIMCSFESPCTTIALNCFVFWENRVFTFWRQTD